MMSATINKHGKLAGQVAVVTGASRGIGEAIAFRYAMEGARVVVSARTVEEGDHALGGSINGVVARILAAGGDYKDINSPQSYKRVLHSLCIYHKVATVPI